MTVDPPEPGELLRVAGMVTLVAVVAPFVAYGVPGIVGGDAAFVVLSSSMEPAMGPGDVIYLRDVPAERIEPGDVITYRATTANDARKVITHRVVDVVRSGDGIEFVTRGDALEEADLYRVPAADVVGRVMFVVPLIGHVVLFAKTKLGLLLLVVLPGAALFVSELWSLLRTVSDGEASGSASGGDD